MFLAVLVVCPPYEKLREPYEKMREAYEEIRQKLSSGKYFSSKVDVTVAIGISTICPIFLEHGAPVNRYLEFTHLQREV